MLSQQTGFCSFSRKAGKKLELWFLVVEKVQIFKNKHGKKLQLLARNQALIQQQLDDATPQSQPPPPINTHDIQYHTTFTQKQIDKHLNKLKSASAGITGLRNDHIKQLLPHDITTTFTIIINNILANNIPANLKNHLATTATTLFVKSSTAVRPIQVSETILRICSRLVTKTAMHYVIPRLKQQFGWLPRWHEHHRQGTTRTKINTPRLDHTTTRHCSSIPKCFPNLSFSSHHPSSS